MNTRFLFPTVALAVAIAVAGCNKAGKLNTPSSSPPPTGPVELKIKWTPNERVVQEVSMQQKMILSIPGQPAPMVQNITIGQKISMNVLSADADGGHEIEVSFLSARISGQVVGNQNVDYDSEKNSSDTQSPVAQVFGKLVGAKLQYFLDVSNNVQRIEGLDALTQRLSSAGRGSEMFKSMFNESYFKEMMSSGRMLPPGPVQPGDTWPVQYTVPLPALGNMTMNYSMNFKGWERHGERNCARIEFTGTIETRQDANAAPKGMSLSIQNGTTSGVLWFDPEFGMTIDSDMNQDMTMFITVPKNARAGQGNGAMQTITNQLSQAFTVKLDSLK